MQHKKIKDCHLERDHAKGLLNCSIGGLGGRDPCYTAVRLTLSDVLAVWPMLYGS